ncbi:MAG: hypothetical protein J6S95_05560 [Lachnospiraceae bacterium]|nr:hypothetical protein [Lachnospiraceae bacterium]
MKKMIVKSMALILALSMTFVSAGCGSSSLSSAVDTIDKTSISAPEKPEVSVSVSEETKPDDTSADTKTDEPEIDYNEIYAPVLSQITEQIIKGLDESGIGEYIPSFVVERIMYEDAYTLLTGIGYLIEDISGDGVPELIVGAMPSDEEIYGVYTVEDGQISLIIDSFTRSTNRYMGDGCFYYLGSGGASRTAIGKARLSRDGTKVEWDDFYFTEEDKDDYTIIYFYHNTEGSWEPDESELTDMTYDDFSKISDEYEGACVQLPLEPLSTLSSIGRIAMEGGLGDRGPIIALNDGEMDGTWTDPALGGTIKLYEYRGEFEYTSSFGVTSEGEIVYNGNPDAPEYTLRKDDGTDLADIFFCKTTNGFTCLVATVYENGQDIELLLLREW